MEKKKVLIGLLLGVSPLLLVGCGNDKKEDEQETKKESSTQILSCVEKEESEGMNFEYEISLTYDKEKKEWTSGEINSVYLFDDANSMSVFKDLDMCEDFEEDKESFFKDCKKISDDKKIGASISLDLDELEKNSENDEIPFKKSYSPEDLKKQFEEDNDKITCSIK